MSSGGYSGGGGGFSGGFGQTMGGFGQPMGGFGQQPQYGGGFGQPFGGFQQPQYGGFGQQPSFGFQRPGSGSPYARQNPYQPQILPQNPPPGMELNPDYRPRGPGMQTMDMRPSDEMFRPIRGANPVTGVMPSEPLPPPSPPDATISDETGQYDPNRGGFSSGTISPVQIQPAVNPSYDMVARPAVMPRYDAPYGGFGGPYGGSPYGGMYGGLGGFFGSPYGLF